jgi:RNAse (barnase) inhibitor barstar
MLGDEQMRREFIIDGNNFDDIDGFYFEIDNLFTKDLDWKTGHNLDAFNDILRGGFGVHECGEPIHIIWKNAIKSRNDFGYEATVKHYKQMLTRCHPSNIEYVQSKLSDAKNRTGKTLMDIVIEIITDTDNSGHNCTLEII